MRAWLSFRSPEWVLISFFGYIAILPPWFRDRPILSYQHLLVFAGVLALFAIIARAGQTRFAKIADLLRDWLPLVLIIVAFREMELFLPRHFGHSFESTWIVWDRLVLGAWGVRKMIESLDSLIPLWLELCYLLVYATGFFCVAILYVERRRSEIPQFLAMYLLGTLLAYALFPYFPSEPPRIVYPHVEQPLITTWARSLNLWILKLGTIHVGVFPSAHVSSVFSAAWAMFLAVPQHKWIGYGLLLYSLSVSLATVYGRYHYVADVLAGCGVSLIPGSLCLVVHLQQMWGKRGRALRNS